MLSGVLSRGRSFLNWNRSYRRCRLFTFHVYAASTVQNLINCYTLCGPVSLQGAECEAIGLPHCRNIEVWCKHYLDFFTLKINFSAAITLDLNAFMLGIHHKWNLFKFGLNARIPLGRFICILVLVLKRAFDTSMKRRKASAAVATTI